MERWIGTTGHWRITCLSSQSLVPAASQRILATGMQRSWGLASSKSYYRANWWCFSTLTCLYVHFRGQKGGPVNPVSFKYSSPSKVNAPTEPVGQEKVGGGGDASLWGGPTTGICHPSWVSAAFCSYLAGQNSVFISPVHQSKQVQAFLMP